MPNALIKFTGSTTGPGGDGEALIGLEGETVTVANVDNTDVDKWQFEVLYSPPGSAITRGVKQAFSTTATWQFVPDSTECFVIRLRVRDANGNESVDDRVFGVREADTDRLVPPFKATGAAMNFGGQTDGWQPYLREYLTALDEIERSGLAKLKGEGVDNVLTSSALAIHYTGDAHANEWDYKIPSIQTTDGTVTTVFTFPTSAGRVYYLTGFITGSSSTAGLRLLYRIEAFFDNVAGTLTQRITTPVTEVHESSTAAVVTVEANAQNIRVRVQGTATATRWRGRLFLHEGLP